MKYNKLIQFKTNEEQYNNIKAEADKYMMSIATYMRLKNTPENALQEK
jgi:hypothetical protein